MAATGCCGSSDRHYNVGDLRRRQTSFVRPRMVCVGCGESVPVGAKSRKTNVMSLSPLLYRRGARRSLKAGRRVCVCEACLSAFVVSGINRRTMAVLDALRESVATLYNAVLQAEGR